jgi:hypothetical protein
VPLVVDVQTTAYQQHLATGVADQTWAAILQEESMTDETAMAEIQVLNGRSTSDVRRCDRCFAKNSSHNAAVTDDCWNWIANSDWVCGTNKNLEEHIVWQCLI